MYFQGDNITETSPQPSLEIVNETIGKETLKKEEFTYIPKPLLITALVLIVATIIVLLGYKKYRKIVANI